MIQISLLVLFATYFLGVYVIIKKVGRGCIVDLGLLFASFVFVYTAIPGFTFLFGNLADIPGWPWQELSKLNPDIDELALHLWRHVIFLIGFLLSYCIIKKRINWSSVRRQLRTISISRRDLFLIAASYILLMAVGAAFSGSSESYIDKYLIRESLSPIQNVLLSIVNRGIVGSQYLLLVAIAIGVKNKISALGGFAAVIVGAVVLSYGSRIEVLFVSLSSLFLIHVYVAQIRLGAAVLTAVVLTVSFGFIEVFRYYDFDFLATLEHFSQFGFKPMGEMAAVFGTGFHLYGLREYGGLPAADIEMFFYEVLSLFSSNANSDSSPQYWYWRNFYPDSPVPPQTNGPIADSAVWGGELDMLLRALLLGSIFAAVSNWCHATRPTVAKVIVYMFFYATCVMNLKYGVLWQLNPLLKTIIPTLLIFYGYRKLIGLDYEKTNISIRSR